MADDNLIADKLDEARALIERGWCQNQLFDQETGGRCVRGALLEVFDDIEDEDAADRLLRRAVNFNDYLGHWNDAPERTQAEVIEAFRKAAELARAEAAQ